MSFPCSIRPMIEFIFIRKILRDANVVVMVNDFFFQKKKEEMIFQSKKRAAGRAGEAAPSTGASQSNGHVQIQIFFLCLSLSLFCNSIQKQVQQHVTYIHSLMYHFGVVISTHITFVPSSSFAPLSQVSNYPFSLPLSFNFMHSQIHFTLCPKSQQIKEETTEQLPSQV